MLRIAKLDDFTAVLMEIQVFWGLTPCRLVSSYEQSKAASGSPKSLLGLLDDLRDEGTILVKTFGHYLPVDTA
jgi:hypothetical protein